MSERLTRKDIKQKDHFVTAVEGTLDYSRSHMRTLGIASAVAVGVVVLGVGGWLFMKHRAQQANVAFEQALEAFSAPVVAEGGTPPAEGALSFPSEEARRQRAKELFQTVVEDHGGAKVSQVAGLYLANIAAAEGDMARAQELWEGFLEDHDRDLLAMQVRLNLLSLKRSNGDREGVVADLEAMLSNQKFELPKDVILFELAQTLEQLSRSDEALTYYQRIVDEFPQSQYANQALQKSQQLGGFSAPA